MKDLTNKRWVLGEQSLCEQMKLKCGFRTPMSFAPYSDCNFGTEEGFKNFLNAMEKDQKAKLKGFLIGLFEPYPYGVDIDSVMLLWRADKTKILDLVGMLDTDEEKHPGTINTIVNNRLIEYRQNNPHDLKFIHYFG